ncbi:hypothetical protein F4560_008650 [Saccharothrix ecbatanensis]|uniref:Uncharacterized protein n=1 Tax=Saccharothrix ecbatanensis TaxID=1105145 RepID=A0A7W9HUR9_9PSEU|nr:hypothetical protein [Saccharothrix ecbatanensis]MBB5808882.1 hypothetical protein [Saccharothrix ecbatanensis]
MTEGRSLFFCLSLTAFFAPLAVVTTRHTLAAAFFRRSAGYGDLASSAVKVYFPLVFGGIGLILSQWLVPGQFKGSDPLLVLLIVLVLAKVENVYEVVRSFRRLVGSRAVIRSRISDVPVRVGRRRRSATAVRRERVAGHGVKRGELASARAHAEA